MEVGSTTTDKYILSWKHNVNNWKVNGYRIADYLITAFPYAQITGELTGGFVRFQLKGSNRMEHQSHHVGNWKIRGRPLTYVRVK